MGRFGENVRYGGDGIEGKSRKARNMLHKGWDRIAERRGPERKNAVEGNIAESRTMDTKRGKWGAGKKKKNDAKLKYLGKKSGRRNRGTLLGGIKNAAATRFSGRGNTDIFANGK